MAQSTKRTPAQRKAWAKLPKWIKAKIRQDPKIKWAQKIKREFEYKCVICASEKDLEAHHIYFQSEYPKLKLDLDNGICLCRKCHDDIHSKFIESPEEYFFIISLRLQFRKPIKRIKKRNSSGYTYSLYKQFEPDKFLADVQVLSSECKDLKKKEKKQTPRKKKRQKTTSKT